MKNKSGTDEILRCSFCHKSQDAVAKLISSPSDYPRAYICDECVAVCNSILEDDRTATPQTSIPNQLPKPQDIVAGGYDFAEKLLSSQRKFADEVVKAAAPLLPGNGSSK